MDEPLWYYLTYIQEPPETIHTDPLENPWAYLSDGWAMVQDALQEVEG